MRNAPTVAHCGIVGAMRRCWLRRSTLEDITVEELEVQIRRAAHCDSVILPVDQLTLLLELAERAAGTYNSLTLKQLKKRMGEAEIELAGDEIRMILGLAIRTKRAEKKRRPHLKVVPPTTRD